MRLLYFISLLDAWMKCMAANPFKHREKGYWTCRLLRDKSISKWQVSKWPSCRHSKICTTVTNHQWESCLTPSSNVWKRQKHLNLKNSYLKSILCVYFTNLKENQRQCPRKHFVLGDASRETESNVDPNKNNAWRGRVPLWES